MFEGHGHYVMMVKINPRDTNTFASASLDKTIKVSVWRVVVGFGTVLCFAYFPKFRRTVLCQRNRAVQALRNCSSRLFVFYAIYLFLCFLFLLPFVFLGLGSDGQHAALFAGRARCPRERSQLHWLLSGCVESFVSACVAVERRKILNMLQNQ